MRKKTRHFQSWIPPKGKRPKGNCCFVVNEDVVRFIAEEYKLYAGREQHTI